MHWDKKRTLDKALAHVPMNIRDDYLARLQVEQDEACGKKQKKEKKQIVSVEAPPFTKGKEEPKTGTAKPASKKDKGKKKDAPKKGKKPDDGGNDNGDTVDEAVTGSLGMITPRPMLVTSVPGQEVRPDLGFSTMTSPSNMYDGHTHTAYYDEAGNGYTSMDMEHTHDIRSFVVSDYQTPHGQRGHGHPGQLPRQGRTKGHEYKDYDGEM